MRKLRAVSVMPIVILALVVCASQQQASAAAPAKLTKIKVGTIPIAYMAPMYAARDKGFFAAEGLEAELQNVVGGTALIPAMEAGQFQFGQSTITTVIMAVQQGLDIKIVVGNTRSPAKPPDDQPLIIRSDSDLTDLKQLEGKRVAANTLYTHNWLLLREQMRRKGGDPGKISFIEIPFPSQPDALLNKQVDAVLAVEPFSTFLAKTGKTKVLSYYLSDALPNLDNAVWLGSGKWIKDHPAETRAFIRAVSKAIDFVNSNPDAKNQIIQGFTKLNPAIIKDLTIPSYSARINLPALRKLTELMLQEGVLKKALDAKSLIYADTPIEQ